MKPKMVRILIQVPLPLKTKLDDQRHAQGISASACIRRLIEQHFKGKKAA
jgi:hypothetical protein